MSADKWLRKRGLERWRQIGMEVVAGENEEERQKRKLLRKEDKRGEREGSERGAAGCNPPNTTAEARERGERRAGGEGKRGQREASGRAARGGRRVVTRRTRQQRRERGERRDERSRRRG